MYTQVQDDLAREGRQGRGSAERQGKGDKTREERRGKGRPGKASGGKARGGKASSGKVRPGEARHGKLLLSCLKVCNIFINFIGHHILSDLFARRRLVDH
jgi:hypothetical protein